MAEEIVIIGATNERLFDIAIGANAEATDGSCGKVARIVVDPIKQSVTHIVVEPRHVEGLGRLVPIDLVESASGEVKLSCSLAQFEGLPFAEETAFLPADATAWGYGPGQALATPLFPAAVPGIVRAGGAAAMPLLVDSVPIGEVEVRRGDRVHASDGEIGKVRGLVVDQDHLVTHLLLEEGHLWAHKRVAIPIKAVTKVAEGGAYVALSKQEIAALPPLE